MSHFIIKAPTQNKEHNIDYTKTSSSNYRNGKPNGNLKDSKAKNLLK